MDAELAEQDAIDETHDNVKPLQIQGIATAHNDEMERVTGIEPAEPQIKPKRDKGKNNDGRQVDAEWTPDE
jgi:hypothetical protein